jgi:hypothetical protein
MKQTQKKEYQNNSLGHPMIETSNNNNNNNNNNNKLFRINNNVTLFCVVNL